MGTLGDWGKGMVDRWSEDDSYMTPMPGNALGSFCPKCNAQTYSMVPHYCVKPSNKSNQSNSTGLEKDVTNG